MFQRGKVPCTECHLVVCKCPRPTAAECVTDEPEADPLPVLERTAEVIEAECRMAIATVAKMPNRGWNDRRARLPKIALVDALLDEWLRTDAGIEAMAPLAYEDAS